MQFTDLNEFICQLLLYAMLGDNVYFSTDLMNALTTPPPV